MNLRASLALALAACVASAACYDQPKDIEALEPGTQNEAVEGSRAPNAGGTEAPPGAPGGSPRPRDRDAGAAASDAAPVDPNAPPPPPAPSFTQVYADVIAGSCVQYCHGASHGTGLAMGDRDQAYANLVGVKAGVGGSAKTCDDGSRTRVVPGDAASSLVIQKIRRIQDCGDPMPPKGEALPLWKVELFEGWINGGAADD